jgi:flagellar biosynthesis regulator FlbT
MKITIDTNEDSKEQIRKAIKLLLSIVGEEQLLQATKDIYEQPQTEVAFGNFFDKIDDKKEPQTKPPVQTYY